MITKKINGLLMGVLVFLVGLILWANWGFSIGRYHLFMDELVSFDGIQLFYSHHARRDMFELITIGGDVRYGRIFWYFPAIIAAFPTFLWGAKAQIIVTRLIVAVLQLVSFYLLSRTFIKSKIMQFLLMLLLMVLPFTPYYMTLPKPEPYVLFFLTAFLLIWTQVPSKKRWAFFCLGAAFGAKVSVLPFLLYFFLVFAWCEALKKSIKPIVTSGLSICAGAIVANPYLLRVLSPSGMQQSIKDVAANAAHGSDSTSISVGSWLHFILTDYFFSPPLLVGVFLISVVLIPSIYTLHQLLRKKQIQALISDPALISFFIGMSFILPVILRIKRLWGMYLHIGFIFLAVASFIVMSQFITQLRMKQIYKKFIATLLFVFILFEITQVTSEYIKAARRDRLETHITKQAEYNYFQRLFEDAYVSKNRRITVLIDPHLYSFQSSETVNIVRFWGPFIRFSEAADFIAIYKRNTYRQRLPDMNENDVEYDSFVKSKYLTESYLKENNEKGFYYRVIDTELNNVVVYEKVKSQGI